MSDVMEERLQGIANVLCQEGLLNKEILLKYQITAFASQQNLLQYLTMNGLVAAHQLATVIARHFELPFIDLDTIEFQSLPLDLIDERLIKKYTFIPLSQQGTQLHLAIDDPTQYAALKDIQFHTGLYIHLAIVETDKLLAFVDKLHQKKEHEGLFDELEMSQPAEDSFNPKFIQKDNAQFDTSNNDPPVVKFIHRILIEGIHKGVSDIHFEPYEETYRIRYRQDGLLKVIASPPPALSARIAARLKIMSNLDISERRLPQDGRFNLTLSATRTIDIRVSSCPTIAGEKIVLRILDPHTTQLGVDALGFNALQKKQFISAITRPQGMILVTGPTGSGKTVTLYTALTHLNTLEKNISTAEDPVEIKLSGINQVNINPKTGLTFSKVLRAFLRQDPDIMMIGEMRDLETAEIAVKAAQTGHLVLSTLHTNSAAETITRLLNIGIPCFNIVSSVNLIIAQRLVRKLCEHCKIIGKDPAQEGMFSEIESPLIQSYKAMGCDQCTDGYRGRIGLFELLPMSKNMSQLIMAGATSMDIFKQAQTEGMLTIHQSGLEYIKAGITTIEEVNRVTVD